MADLAVADGEFLADLRAAYVCPASEQPRLFWPGAFNPQLASRLAGPEILQRIPATGSYWWFETSDGTVFDFPCALVRAWERPPFSILLRLVSNSHGPRVMAEAVISTRSALADLQAKAIDTMATLLRRAMDNPARSVGVLRDAAPALPPKSPVPAMLGGHIRRLAHRVLDKLLVEEWGIGLVDQEVADLARGETMRSIRWLRHDPRTNLADPHPWPGTGRILCEEFGIGGGGAAALGRIVALELDADQRRITGKRLILGGGRHRSYPGTFADSFGTLLLPESPSRGGTTLYRLDDDGALNEIRQVAPDLRMGDPTLFRHGCRWWIAFSDLDIGEHDNLCLLFADDLTGPWQSHSGNPVKIDIRSARPAGPLFQSKDGLIRPAQNCARSYGASIVLNLVDVLTTDRYEEHVIQHLQPAAQGRYPHGLHTVADFNGSILVDGKRSAFRLRHLFAKTCRALSRMQTGRTSLMKAAG